MNFKSRGSTCKSYSNNKHRDTTQGYAYISSTLITIGEKCLLEGCVCGVSLVLFVSSRQHEFKNYNTIQYNDMLVSQGKERNTQLKSILKLVSFRCGHSV